MTFTLYVNQARWRAHLQQVVGSTPGIVPVMKGNGYGMGNARLAQEASALGVDTVAVGTADELAEVREHFADQVLKTTIPRSVRVSEAPSYGQTVMTYDPASPGALSYLEAAREVAQQVTQGARR